MAKKKSLGIVWCNYKKKIEQGRFSSFDGVECETDDAKLRIIKFDTVILHKKGSLRKAKWKKSR